MNELLIITTGGTIDKVYFDANSDYEVGEPEIGRILESFSAAFRYRVIPLLRKDSLQMNAADRALIRTTIEQNPHLHVLITHGTDTMIDTALALDGLGERRIVLTGALNPARFQGSDAVFNIGCAVGAVQSVKPGVYVVMNGRVWDPHQVRKNRDQNRFEAVIGGLTQVPASD
ncbi:MAG: asparaginase [Gammaproteobacteria bacterium]|nr:asparaginase [Gammaproteobacteria bacterium]